MRKLLECILPVIGTLAVATDVSARPPRRPVHVEPRWEARFIPATEQINSCRGGVGTATHVFQIEIRDPLNMQDINAYISEMNTNAGGTDGDYSSHYDYVYKEIYSPPSRLDIDLNLFMNSDPPQGKHKVVLIKVIIDGGVAKFPKGFSITTNHPNGHSMFCGLSEASDTVAIFKAHWIPHSTRYTYGAFNINLVIPDRNDPTHKFILPITIDPSVKNNG